MTKQTLLSVVGATATGKTAIALQLAQAFNTSIVSADSRQLYKETSIGTAKPTDAELALVPHLFINHLSITKDYSAGKFEKQVLTALRKLFKETEVVVMAGGSGLYIQAVLEGFDELPTVEPGVRESLNAEWDKSRGALQQELKDKDPEYYKLVDKQNPQRVIRALELIRSTGKSFTELRKKKVKKRPFNVIKIGLEVDRDELYQRIDDRVDEMIAAGLVAEAKALHPKRGLNALETVGYTELFNHFEGQYDLEEAITLIKRNSRHYAKRQMTWFRRDVDIKWFSPTDYKGILAYIRSVID